LTENAESRHDPKIWGNRPPPEQPFRSNIEISKG
jgi:hypothetical protein